MDKLEQAIQEVHRTDDIRPKSVVHPLAKLFVTLFYMLAVLSFQKYHGIGLIGMALYLFIQCIWCEIKVLEMLKRIWPVFVMTGLLGIANPLLDRAVYVFLGNLKITYGMVSMLTLLLKGVFCVISSYILLQSIGMEQLCYTLRILHIPEEIITILFLMQRYLIVLMKEVKRMQQAYKLRAPKQRGLRFGTWGSFVGLLLIRSIDRAQEVQESMELRGFHGKMQVSGYTFCIGTSVLYAMGWGIFILLLRIFPIFQIVGNWLVAT